MSLDVESPMEAMRATMLQIQQQMREQMQAQAQQQRDFEARIQALLAVNKEALEAPKVSIAPTPVHVNEPVDQPLDDAAKHIPSKDHLDYSFKIKPSDLPKFEGEKGEDVETWIEQLSGIFEATKCTNAEITAFLSVILKDTALKWFTRIGPKGRSQLPTWIHWQEGLRQRFLKANYLAEKKRQWKKRDLRANEYMADYFDAKVDLQAYVFDEHTPEAELILDILVGLPYYMLPTLKSSITPDMDLLEFRRILLDYETGLRWNGPWNSRKQDNAYTPRQGNTPGDRPKNINANKDKDGSKPPRPVHVLVESNNVSSYRSNPNEIPVSGSRWPTYGKTGEAKKKGGTEAHMNYVRIEPEEEEEPEQVIELSLPDQDNEGYDELYPSPPSQKPFVHARYFR
ncbi:hypothetical protein QFC24_006946 [Naganishia onofrii]|uniref:Uncharacterized protein n=1 Tax=Naganishia onofrii TaxID=1851511 RepID=A0ACC2WUR0_9TREE|nr:hypothetical protein QFC24_006946 [Naganishia onofrii]